GHPVSRLTAPLPRAVSFLVGLVCPIRIDLFLGVAASINGLLVLNEPLTGRLASGPLLGLGLQFALTVQLGWDSADAEEDGLTLLPMLQNMTADQFGQGFTSYYSIPVES